MPMIFQPTILAEMSENASYYAIGAVILIAFAVIGFKDLLRFSLTRAWAISSVCFSESIRKRVLWIIPLAVVGVFIVTQLQHPQDEQDAIRQTIKTALFATGTLLVVTSIILAGTNLPKEIDNRVIFTIVTKPVTRLEIVLGKIIGFARVSAVILLLMGAFSYTYLHLRATRLESGIRDALKNGQVDATNRSTLEHYAQDGLLIARSLAGASKVQFFAKLPDDKDPLRWFSANGDQLPRVMFPADAGAFLLPGKPTPGPGEAVDPSSLGAVIIDIKVTPSAQVAPTTANSPAVPVPLPLLASTQPSTYLPNRAKDPQVFVNITDRDGYDLLLNHLISPGRPQPINADGSAVRFFLKPEQVLNILQKCGGSFGVQIGGSAKGVNFGLDDSSLRLMVVDPARPEAGARVLAAKVADFDFRGRMGREGEQLRGDTPAQAPVSVYRFENLKLDTSSDIVPVEFRTDIERGGYDEEGSEDSLTRVSLRVMDRQTGLTSDPIEIRPENRRWMYLNFPRKFMQSGNFDLLIRCTTKDNWVGLTARSISVVTQRGSFVINLFKSLLILWLLSVLVISIAIFCSTFLSWPIAIMLTVMILLGHWAVTQISDSLTSDLGHSVAQGWFGSDTGSASSARFRVVSESVDLLAKTLKTLASLLPDIDHFSVTENIERGLAIPWTQVFEALTVIGLFAVPMAILGYIWLRFKEVAP